MNNNINTSEIFNISKALIIGFFGFWFCNYLALIVGLTSGVIDVMPSAEYHIYVPTYTMVISAIGFLYCLKNRKQLNYKHFLVFFHFGKFGDDVSPYLHTKTYFPSNGKNTLLHHGICTMGDYS